MMTNILKVEVISFIVLFLVFILNSIRKNKMSLKYSLIWIFASMIILIFILIPGLLDRLTKILGFEMPSNMIYMLAIVAILLIILSLTAIVSHQADQIRLLIQEVSLLKEKNIGGKKNER